MGNDALDGNFSGPHWAGWNPVREEETTTDARDDYAFFSGGVDPTMGELLGEAVMERFDVPDNLVDTHP